MVFACGKASWPGDEPKVQDHLAPNDGLEGGVQRKG